MKVFSAFVVEVVEQWRVVVEDCRTGALKSAQEVISHFLGGSHFYLSKIIYQKEYQTVKNLSLMHCMRGKLLSFDALFILFDYLF